MQTTRRGFLGVLAGVAAAVGFAPKQADAAPAPVPPPKPEPAPLPTVSGRGQLSFQSEDVVLIADTTIDKGDVVAIGIGDGEQIMFTQATPITATTMHRGILGIALENAQRGDRVRVRLRGLVEGKAGERPTYFSGF